MSTQILRPPVVTTSSGAAVTTPPRVSVVMPTHRRPELLRKALVTLEAQTLAHDQFEVIVVASENDAAADVVGDFAANGILNIRCVTIPNDPWRGRSASAKRNYGVKVSAGPWIAFIDDDCLAHPGWLEGALPLFENPKAGGVEGRKDIPTPPRPTVTYKGLMTFTRPKGYQTCNIFYRRDVFERVGGFDTNLPYYLEDSDIAWSVLDAGYEIPHAENAVVSHPVLPGAPWKLLDDAKRAALMPYLYKKHTAKYVGAKTRVLRGAHWVYLLVYASIIAALAFKLWWVALGGVALVGLLVAAHAYKQFRGCDKTAHEVAVTALLLPVVPVVKWVQLIRGNIKHKVWLWT
ncbi:MAG TPA: glycosyltransferase family A protein [Tepidisphaeraceae bacterium]|nr:glycosyltransferase family A protein [Tepidisphaeraceae bacterium]